MSCVSFSSQSIIKDLGLSANLKYAPICIAKAQMAGVRYTLCSSLNYWMLLIGNKVIKGCGVAILYMLGAQES